MAEVILCVPGIGMGGLELMGMARVLRRRGYIVRTLWKNPYQGAAESVDALRRLILAHAGAQPHIVAHSLGGLLTLQTLRDYPTLSVGRVVLLGVPLQGCGAARRVRQIPGGGRAMGSGITAFCDAPAPDFPDGLDVGGIAGRINFLLGTVLCPRAPNDTLITVEETKHRGLSAHRVLPVSHTGMLFSLQVAREIITFLQTGLFSD